MKKLLIGGSPCTYWSIAQKNGRETEASGIGWELFKNFLIAKEKFKPDYFLYENNKSAAQAIKDQIKHELNVWDGTLFMADSGARYIEINSALVSAQNRQRFYVHNCGEVEQPADRGILLRDILESGLSWKCKSYCIYSNYYKGCNFSSFDRQSGKRAMVAEPIRIPPYGNADKSRPVRASYAYKGSGAVPCECATFSPPHGWNEGIINYDKFPTLTTGSQARQQNVLIQSAEHYKTDDKPLAFINKIYEVKDGQITIKDKQYPIKLPDGYYIIRKLTITEGERLQTLPDGYTQRAGVSNSQCYKGLGNGWTAEVIMHILNGALANVPKDEEIVVLSMYDGIGTGRYCLDKMGFTNVKYFAYEIDKYAMQIAKSNYPGIVEMGDAFQVREANWRIL